MVMIPLCLFSYVIQNRNRTSGGGEIYGKSLGILRAN